MKTRRALAVSGMAALALGLSGCGLLSRGVYDMPLPGGADIGSDPIVLTAEFDDVLDLVPQSAVKVDNVAVGRVDSIELAPDGRSAEVKILVNRKVDLPSNTTARLQQTTLLGEKYVALVRPEAAGTGGQLASGSHLTLDKTDLAAEVEQVLGALSLVLNGGGIEQFHDISTELQNVSGDDPKRVRTFLTQMESFVTGLDKRKESITDALDAVAELSATLDGDTDKIVNALDNLSPGMASLEQQRPQLVKMLKALDSLSGIAVKTLDASQADIIADLKALDPVLKQLAKSGKDLPNSLQILLTYPFPDSVLNVIRGDYLNIFVTTNFRSLPPDCAAIGCFWPQVGTAGAPGLRGLKRGVNPLSLIPPTDSAVPGLPSPSISVPTPTAPEPSPEPTPDESPVPSPSPSPSDSPEPSASPSPSSSPSPTADSQESQ